MELEKYYSLKGYKSPKYSFVNIINEFGIKMFYAETILPNGMTIRGEPKHSTIEVCIICVINLKIIILVLFK